MENVNAAVYVDKNTHGSRIEIREIQNVDPSFKGHVGTFREGHASRFVLASYIAPLRHFLVMAAAIWRHYRAVMRAYCLVLLNSGFAQADVAGYWPNYAPLLMFAA